MVELSECVDAAGENREGERRLGMSTTIIDDGFYLFWISGKLRELRFGHLQKA
jgi:hypothetical protein